MKMPSEMFKPGSVGDELANDLAREFALADELLCPVGHKFDYDDIIEAPYRARAEIAITWMLKPEVREKLGEMK